VAKADIDDIKEIIQGCIHKSEKSREVLYRNFFGYAMSVALLYSKNRNDAIEIVDDSFLKVFSEIRKYDPEKPFKSWFRKIVINTSIDKFRKESKRSSFSQIEEIPTQDSSPGAISNLTADDIMSLLNYLPQIHKTVFCLYEIEGYSHEEISKKMNIPTSSSRVYLTRSKRRLQELFQLHFNSTHK